MSFSSQKGEFDRFFNRLDRPVEESRPDRQPDRPVDPTGFHLWYVVRTEFMFEANYKYTPTLTILRTLWTWIRS